MDQGLSRLSERERAVLHLLARGHDAKSIADHVGVSVHAVNERLRQARRKLGVSSSREAARMLLAAESSPPDFLVDKEIGIGGTFISGIDGARHKAGTAGRYRLLAYALGAAVMILLVFSTLAFWTSGDGEARRQEVPPPPPRVVATIPAQGSAVRPGPVDVTVRFDRPMRAGDYSFVQASAETYPDCEARPTLSADRRTFTLRCNLSPGRQYEMWFNREPYMNFRSEGGESAQPYRLMFRTHDR